MTLTLPGADYRAFYQQLGIPLPDIPRTNVSVRCFADPAAHHREDRDPSCSVNTLNGAWNCHACGAHGTTSVPASPIFAQIAQKSPGTTVGVF